MSKSVRKRADLAGMVHSVVVSLWKYSVIQKKWKVEKQKPYFIGAREDLWNFIYLIFIEYKRKPEQSTESISFFNPKCTTTNMFARNPSQSFLYRILITCTRTLLPSSLCENFSNFTFLLLRHRRKEMSSYTHGPSPAWIDIMNLFTSKKPQSIYIQSSPNDMHTSSVVLLHATS